MLSRFDEYLIHQTPEPLAHPLSMDRNIYDRYWLGGFTANASLYFAISFGLYPNRQVMDAAISIIRDGEQVAFFASRRAPRNREDTQVGPLKITVLEPMQSLRVTLAPNESGISCDMVFAGHSVCVQEDRQMLRHDQGTWMDVTRFTQFGRWSGQLSLGSHDIPLKPEQVHGIRDRSWGRRQVGETDAGAPSGPPQIYFFWAPLIWDDHATLAVFFEDEQGRPLHAEGKSVPLYDDPRSLPGLDDQGIERMSGVAHQLAYVPGTRRAAKAELQLMSADGSVRAATLTPLLRHQMKGTGYGHPVWKHGKWHGELHCATERWPLAELDPLAPENIHIQQLVRCTSNGRQGIGVMEQVCIGPHRRSGFTKRLDGAR